jgi:hypothetical protein
MTGGFAVDRTTLHRAAPSFADAGQELTEALAHLRSVLAGCADMCGDDEHGRAFAAHYHPRAASVHDVLALGGPAVHRIGTGVSTMATDYSHMEDVNTRAVPKISETGT